jgi:hypothetical protein
VIISGRSIENVGAGIGTGIKRSYEGEAEEDGTWTVSVAVELDTRVVLKNVMRASPVGEQKLGVTMGE